MTENIAPIEILKSRQNFTDYVEEHSDEIIEKLLEVYPKRIINIVVPQLTQSDDGLMNAVMQFQGIQKGYIFWFIANEKERLINICETLNQAFHDSYGIFIIKANLNGDKIEFEPLLKPNIKEKAQRNNKTQVKQLQEDYWQRYFEICDTLQSEVQVTPAPRHYQYISIGKTGVQIMQTINTQKGYVATEIAINNNKEIFNKLFEQKNEIEKELGELYWHSLERNKSSNIRKIYNVEILNRNNWEKAITKHIEMAEKFKVVFRKYL